MWEKKLTAARRTVDKNKKEKIVEDGKTKKKN